MTRPDLAIVGGGILGRLLAWRAVLGGLQVALYEAGDRSGAQATAWTAAGMVTPQAEAVDADAELVAMGRRSLALWPVWLAALPIPVHYDSNGTVILWQRSDAAEMRRFAALLRARDPLANFQHLDAPALALKEPALEGRFREALFLPHEAHVDNRQLLPALADALEAAGVDCHWNHRVEDTERPEAALVIDCRGRQAKSRWPQLRGVRGEIARLYAPGLALCHMIRLLHPRYAIYLISRPGGHVVVGATTIESDDDSPVSMRGALELLSAAITVLPELGEARILSLDSNCRPALPDNKPAIHYSPSERVLAVNGLYRHGFLLSPAVAEEIMCILPQMLAHPKLALSDSPRWASLVGREEALLCR